MSAIRVARGFTGRPFVIKFEGCYHGHADALLVKAGSGVATFGIPGSAGVPAETVMHTLALPYNDLAAVEAAFEAHPEQIACVILEPVVTLLLAGLALLGLLLTLFFYLVGPPGFPVWTMLALSLGFAIVLVPYHASIRLLSSR